MITRCRWRGWWGMVVVLFAAALITSCDRQNSPNTATLALEPTLSPDLPQITAVELDRTELPRYESLEMTLTVSAEYDNPYDAREVTLDGLFTDPDGTEMLVPGFWDGEDAWRIRFTPSQVGEWQYQLTVTDKHGTSPPTKGTITATASDLHGWLQPGDWVNPAYSGHYLVHHDGTPFYGVGHCDALNILIDGFTVENGVGLFDNMKAAQENFVVWWPLYTNSPINQSYDDYSVSNLKLIDTVIKDAEKEGIFLVFTVWDHPELRDETHAWGDGRWQTNGFKKLGDLETFFTSDESWAWQTNFYRYIIARWGYSRAVGLWQTVSELNGTNAYDQADAWHSRVDGYFKSNDPYRHPTTASMAGDIDWETGHLAMDAPQVHLYAFDNDAVGAAAILADWTSLMWNRATKPNWVGEFGVPGDTYYPELFHNPIWAALANGAAMTPAEWNSGGNWMRMSEAMNADIGRLAQFVHGLPLAAWNPSPLTLSLSDAAVRGWGVAGPEGGLFWVQDFAQEGQGIEEVRAAAIPRSSLHLDIQGLASGTYTATPYDTWQGIYLDTIPLECTDNQPCSLTLPTFTRDMAFKIERN